MEINGDAANVDDLTTLTLYNYGNFTSMEVDGLRVKGLSLHLDRLSKDSTVIHGTGVSRDRVRELIKRSTGPNERHIVRVSILSRVFDLGHPSKPLVPDILISSRPAPAAALAPVTLRTHHFERHLPLVKHVGLLGSLYLRRAVQLLIDMTTSFSSDRSGAISGGCNLEYRPCERGDRSLAFSSMPARGNNATADHGHRKFQASTVRRHYKLERA